VLTGLGARAGFSRKDLRKVAPIDNESSDLQSLKIEIQNRVSNKNIEIWFLCHSLIYKAFEFQMEEEFVKKTSIKLLFSLARENARV
jgi:hypothetical protein